MGLIAYLTETVTCLPQHSGPQFRWRLLGIVDGVHMGRGNGDVVS